VPRRASLEKESCFCVIVAKVVVKDPAHSFWSSPFVLREGSYFDSLIV
jgi:hypothetical protein